MQVYVVMSQAQLMSPFNGGVPLAAFEDYPSALAYAQTNFKQTFAFNGQTAKDLIFLLTVSTTPVVIPPTAPVPTSSIAPITFK